MNNFFLLSLLVCFSSPQISDAACIKKEPLSEEERTKIIDATRRKIAATKNISRRSADKQEQPSREPSRHDSAFSEINSAEEEFRAQEITKFLALTKLAAVMICYKKTDLHYAGISHACINNAMTNREDEALLRNAFFAEKHFIQGEQNFSESQSQTILIFFETIAFFAPYFPIPFIPTPFENRKPFTKNSPATPPYISSLSPYLSGAEQVLLYRLETCYSEEKGVFTSLPKLENPLKTIRSLLEIMSKYVSFGLVFCCTRIIDRHIPMHYEDPYASFIASYKNTLSKDFTDTTRAKATAQWDYLSNLIFSEIKPVSTEEKNTLPEILHTKNILQQATIWASNVSSYISPEFTSKI